MLVTDNQMMRQMMKMRLTPFEGEGEEDKVSLLLDEEESSQHPDSANA